MAKNASDFNYANNSFTNMIPMDNPTEMLSPWVRNVYLPYIILVHILVFIVGSFGNVIVIAIMVTDRKNHNATTPLFLQSLAFADLLMILICTPLEVYQYFAFDWDARGIICKLASFAEFMSAIASVLNLLAVTIERFIVIVFPLRSRAICTIHNCRRAVAFVWFLSFLISTPVLLTKGTYTLTYYNNETSVAIHYCNDVEDKFAEKFAIYQLVTLFVLPGSLMIICYTYVIRELWRSTKNMQMLTNTQETGIRKYKSSQSPRFRKRTVTRPTQNREIAEREASGVSREPEPVAGPSNAIETVETTVAPVNEERQGATERDEQLHNEAKRVVETNSRRFNEIKTARKQVIKMLVLVVTLFHLCWGPKIIMYVLIKHGMLGFSQHIYAVRAVVNFLPFIHACMNPCIYCMMSRKFRNCLNRLYERIRCGKGKSTTESRIQSRECRGAPQVASCRQYRRCESIASARLLQHRGSTTTSSTNVNASALVEPVRPAEQRARSESIKHIEIIDEGDAEQQAPSKSIEHIEIIDEGEAEQRARSESIEHIEIIDEGEAAEALILSECEETAL